MKAYLAGKIGSEHEKNLLEKIDKLCVSIGIETFLPHRDVGLASGIKDAKRIFEGDIENGFAGCDVVIAVLDGLHVGAGTAWELGYAYALGIPAIGIKTDESVEEGFEYLSSIIVASTPIVTSIGELREKLVEMKNEK